MTFKDRIDAGLQLAFKLKKYVIDPCVVLAVPRGGVPVAYTVASELNFPMQLVLTKKIGHPINKEYAIGAVTLENSILSDAAKEVSPVYIYDETEEFGNFINEKIDVFFVPSFKEGIYLSEELKSKIENVMVREKLYLEPELSLSDLAQKLKTNTSVLSAAINSNFGKNFNDFVNEYRVEEFKKQIKLSQNQNYTLLAIAFDCGFNSKATFNRAFKKFTGQSPSRFEEA